MAQRHPASYVRRLYFEGPRTKLAAPITVFFSKTAVWRRRGLVPGGAGDFTHAGDTGRTGPEDDGRRETAGRQSGAV